MTDVIILKDNGDGTLLGADQTGKLYDGAKTRVGFDALTVTTTVSSDGLSFERVTSHGDQVIGKGTTTRAGFDAANQATAEATVAQDPTQTVKGVLDALWAREKAIDAHGTQYVDVLDSNGDLTTVEKTLAVTTWTARP